MTSRNPNPKTFNGWADFWRYRIGINVIPADGIRKDTYEHWRPFQNNPIPKEQHDQWKANNEFRKGLAIIPGKVWHNPARRHLCLFALDIDNEPGIKEFLASVKAESLEQVAQKLIVEQHANKSRCHIYGYCSKELKKRILKSSNGNGNGHDSNNIPIIEIRDSRTISVCTNSPHKDGSNHRIIGTLDLVPEPVDIEEPIIGIYRKYNLLVRDGNRNNNTKELFTNGNKIPEGARNKSLFDLFRKLIAQNYDLLPEEQVKKLAYEANQNLCEIPLPNSEFEIIWRNAQNYTPRQNSSQSESFRDDLVGNVFYKIAEVPARYIIAYKQTKHLIEAQVKSEDTKVDGIDVKEYYLYHNKTFLTCIPTRIVRHKSPLTFLEDTPKYTFEFEDAVGEKYIQSHKTLPEILSGLKDRGYVNSDAAEGALGAMLQAFKETKLIEDNDEMAHIGFFTDKDRKIIPSNIKLKHLGTIIPELKDALLFIDELKPYYEKRLDLLSTSIVWGMIAPAVFILKTNNYFLKWPHFYGFPNATKSNTGKIMLAIDGHHDNPDYLLNISRIDTIARLGDVVSHTTFPKLVDEVNLNGKDKEWLVNALKSVIESRIARSKFMSNNASTSTGIPALSPLILTSNPPPPFHDSGYMRRIIERNFPQSESWKEDDKTAIQFKEFLRTNLHRLKPLGDFRNWYIMNHQDKILDEARAPPLDLGFKILEEAYRATGIEKIPDWLRLRLPENQLEESIQDNGVIVKRAFEKYINEQMNRALQMWKAKTENGFVEIPADISDRLWKLVQSNLLPDIKLTKNWEVLIRKGFLTELYNYGVSRDQLPNLRALADYMKVNKENYRISNGTQVVAASKAQLYDYFDKIDDDKEEKGQ